MDNLVVLIVIIGIIANAIKSMRAASPKRPPMPPPSSTPRTPTVPTQGSYTGVPSQGTAQTYGSARPVQQISPMQTTGNRVYQSGDQTTSMSQQRVYQNRLNAPSDMQQRLAGPQGQGNRVPSSTGRSSSQSSNDIARLRAASDKAYEEERQTQKLIDVAEQQQDAEAAEAAIGNFPIGDSEPSSGFTSQRPLLSLTRGDPMLDAIILAQVFNKPKSLELHNKT